MLYLLFLALCITLVLSQEWVVNIESGAVRGWWREDYDVWAFTGIPYATPPLGELRFKAPRPPTPWNGIFNATNNYTICVQAPQRAVPGTVMTEDCLIINVFAPQSAISQGSLPVLFFLHGGGFTFGNSINTYNPRWTTRHDIILVTFNYRLGAFGYMCLGTEKVPGNAGLKDVLAALRWTKTNIRNFGGDPEAITIYGESASGFQTEALVLSEVAEGLFQRAIVESGSTNSLYGHSRLGSAKILANNLGYAYLDDLDGLASFLETVTADDLRSRTTTTHSVCVERNIKRVESFVSDRFRNTLLSGSYKHVPIMYAYAELDGMLLETDFYSKVEEIQNDFINFLPSELIFQSELERSNVAQLLRAEYFGTGQITNDSILNYMEYASDFRFVAGMMESSLQHAINDVPVYVMELSYRGGFNQPSPFPDINIASHADIVAHVMDLGHYNDATLAQDQIIRDRMTQLFTDFVKYGNPTPVSSTLGIQWLPFTQEQQHYLNVGTNLSVRQFPRHNRTALWSQIYNSYYYSPPLFDNSLSGACVNFANLVFILSALIVSLLNIY